MQTITMETPAGSIYGYLGQPNRTIAGPAVLLTHGFAVDAASNYGDLPDRLAAKGITSLAIDLPGHGKNIGERGDYTYDQMQAAQIAAYDYLAGLDSVDLDNITAVGTSLGGYLSTCLSLDRQLSRLALWVPANVPDENRSKLLRDAALTPEVHAWRGQRQDIDDCMMLRAIRAFERPILLIEAERDEYVPHQTIENIMYAAAPFGDKLDHVVIDDMSHIMSKTPSKKFLADALTEVWLSMER